MELIPLCQALETTSHISHCSTPSQVLTTSHLLLQAWDIQVQLLGYHSLILCASTTFLMSLLLTNSWLPSAFWFFGWRYDFIFLISMWFLIIYMKFEFRFFGVTYIYYLYTCHFCTDFVKLLQFQCILMVFLNFLGKETYP